MELNQDLQVDTHDDAVGDDNGEKVDEVVEVIDEVKENEGQEEPKAVVEETVMEEKAKAVVQEVPKTEVKEVPVIGGSSAYEKPKKKGNAMGLGMVLMAIAVLCGVGFGVWTMMDAETQKKELNSQISTLRQENNDLQERLSTGTSTDIDIIDTDSYSNPIITSNSADSSSVISFVSSAIGEIEGTSFNLHIEVENGAIRSCDVSYANYNEGGVADVCEITGLNGNIYKVVEFGRGQDKTMNKIGFIMSDGTVQYLSLSDAIEEKNYAIQGSLKIDGFVTDAIKIQVVGTSSGHFSTMFVLRDGSVVELDDAMLN